MKIDTALIDILLYGEEGVDLDFKRDQYKFTKASDEEKCELLKDILAFSNSWRRTDAFILIGIKEVKGGKSEVEGISEKLDDAQIQQFVNSKTQKPITFSYRNLDFKNKHIGVIHIPIQNRPFYLKKDYGNLKKETVYIKRGSSTDIAKLDEISKMGINSFVSEEKSPILEIYFVDKEKREILPDTYSSSSLVLNVPRQKDIPDYKGNKQRPALGYSFDLDRTNSDYYRELTRFTSIHRLTFPIYFAIKNSGSGVANDVRVEIKIQDSKNIIQALDEYGMPKVPQYSYSPLRDISYKLQGVVASRDLTVKRISDYWLVETSVEKVQPQSTAWIESCLHIGALEKVEFCIETTIYSDNLPEPTTKNLLIKIDSEKIDASLDIIIELESERFRNSDEYKRFLERHTDKFK
ncbi:AlbA family DNA-binding domain-containing protein [Desulfomicrobium salsuginis]